MALKKLVSFLSKARRLVLASLGAGLLVGLMTAFFFNPYVVSYRIKNVGSYFDIESLKSVKLEITSLSRELLTKMTDRERAESLKKMLGKPDWVETNITPVFGITKADVRDMIEGQLVKIPVVDNFISFINFKQNAEDVAWAKDNLKFVADYTLKVVQRDRLTKWLSNVRIGHQQSLMDVSQQLPNISLLSESNERRIEQIKNIVATNPNAAKNAQLYLTMNQGQVNNNNINTRIPINNEDLTTFIAPEIQLSGLQINQRYLETMLSQLQLKKDVSEYLVAQSIEGQNFINNFDMSVVNETPDLPENFWRRGKISDLLKTDTGWRHDYIENSVRLIESQQRQSRAAYEEISKQVQLVDYNLKFSRSLVILLGLVSGLIFPVLVFYVKQVSEEEQSTSEKE